MRQLLLADEIARIDGIAPTRRLGKHVKMTASPFVFYRGTAQLFYTDIAHKTLSYPPELDAIPLTSVIGDCHVGNFGFLSEEGSHGDTIIFAPNDFDDACVGSANWDLLRFMSSLKLAYLHCDGAKRGRYNVKDCDTSKPLASVAQVHEAQRAFMRSYIHTCQRVIDDPYVVYEALDSRPDKIPSKLAKLYDKAVSRSSCGEAFTTKSALARAVQFDDDGLRFKDIQSKFTPLSSERFSALNDWFAPYMDDSVIDIVQRVNAGTGSVNMNRYYFLVGPRKPHDDADFAACHIVEVKQQREAAPLAYFSSINPVNHLNPAHLTARTQRRMQRKPDLLLDEAEFEGSHYLIRSRHHAKVGVAPQDIVMGNKAINGGLVYFGELCGYTLALGHCRGDRRSTRFAHASAYWLEIYQESLIDLANHYVEQVVSDYNWFVSMLSE